MIFVPLNADNAEQAVMLFNESTDRGEQYYCKLSQEEFTKLFLVPVKPKDKVFAFYTEDHKAFIIGHYDDNTGRFFLTMIQVDPSIRRQGVGTALVNHLNDVCDDYAGKQNLAPVELEISYYNPVMIRWDLPGTPHHYHNNAEGVILGSPAHLFFKNTDFRDIDSQNTYYMKLSEYVWSEEKMKPYEERVHQAGYRVEFYDPKKHSDASMLLKDLDNDLWNWQIPAELNREGGHRPLLILNDHGKMSGFAGPIVVEPTGRAWILGVAVYSGCRGCGAATLLFNHMVDELRKAGAEYFTFFTAEHNFARNIYEGAGFRIHASWATMRRRVQKH